MHLKPLLYRFGAIAGLVMSSSISAAPPPTAADVGDANSFGKRVVWLGQVSTGAVILTDDCSATALGFTLGPDDRCVVLNPAPLPTHFNFPDLGRITLPAGSTNSLICQWATPSVTYSAFNPAAVNAPSSFTARATYRIESEVLNDPALINPETGLPFGGGIDVAITVVVESQTLPPGVQQTHSHRATRACIAGLVSKANLIEGYGLSEALVRKFFGKPITIRAGASGSAHGVANANLFFSTRLTGDEK